MTFFYKQWFQVAFKRHFVTWCFDALLALCFLGTFVPWFKLFFERNQVPPHVASVNCILRYHWQGEGTEQLSTYSAVIFFVGETSTSSCEEQDEVWSYHTVYHCLWSVSNDNLCFSHMCMILINTQLFQSNTSNKTRVRVDASSCRGALCTRIISHSDIDYTSLTQRCDFASRRQNAITDVRTGWAKHKQGQHTSGRKIYYNNKKNTFVSFLSIGWDLYAWMLL